MVITCQNYRQKNDYEYTLYCKASYNFYFFAENVYEATPKVSKITLTCIIIPVKKLVVVVNGVTTIELFHLNNSKYKFLFGTFSHISIFFFIYKFINYNCHIILLTQSIPWYMKRLAYFRIF